MKNDIVVLAFSGGLDTSFCVKYLSVEKKLKVYTVFVNTGGYEKIDLENLEKKSYKLGAVNHINIDKTLDFYEKCIKYMVFGNMLKNKTYPLSVSSERVFQAIATAIYAKEVGASYVAHGCTAAGNDQVRFDMIFQIFVPDKEILSPIRDLKLSRKEEIDYLARFGINLPFKKAKYSINKGIWGTSISGSETLTSNKILPDNAFTSSLKKEKKQKYILEFKKGEIVKINDELLNPLDAIKKIEDIASQFAIGRGYHTGDTIIGIKGRIGFEAAAPLVIIKAHETLEKHTLTKWQIYWKDQIANWYGMMLHEGHYLDPVMRDMEVFLTNTQKTVSGKVWVSFYPYRFEIEGIESKYDLMNNDSAVYGEELNAWSFDEAKGFAKILSNQTKIYHTLNKNEIEDI